ncbi:MAG: subtype A tannase [Coriobacteriales bacterium]|nr:subtype A tannase [Coriobacteriales bacterium]
MSITRRGFLGMGAVSAAFLAACGAQNTQTNSSGEVTNSVALTDEISSNLALDSSAWGYDAENDVYYQLGISYCEKPADESYEQLAILVPGAYFTGTDNGDGTYTCEVNETGTVGSYTALTAPIVMPVNTPGYSAQSPMSDYSAQTAYTGEGIVYVHAGCRGRDAGAPAGVVDLKAAVRFLRLVKDQIAGDVERIFTFGMSGGGAQSALMGATGDSELYEPYLQAIGAVSGASDAVLGSMDWCPITGLDVADEAYEWMMGCTRSGLSDDEQAISTALAEDYAAWVNAAGITDESGAMLELAESGEGTYQAGSYYERVREAIEESLNNFLADTEFPYDASSSGGMMGGAPGGGAPGGERPSGEAPNDMGEGGPSGAPGGSMTDMAAAEQNDDISRTQTTGGVSLSGTYETAADYVAALNADTEWVSYDEATNTATISSVADFCVALKQASKSLGAFDQLDRGQGENTLFGEDGSASHFDARMAQVLNGLGSSYAADYDEDLARVDALGTSVATRVAMYTPLYYLLPSERGYGSSEPARHWRIRTGIEQGDTSLTTELNLALALEADSRVESVDFATVWGQGHTQAERTGTAGQNFIAWVADCLA